MSFRLLKLVLGLGVWIAVSPAAPAPRPLGPVELVHDFYPGEFSDSQSMPHLTRLGKTLFFVMTDLDTGQEVWRTDGTREGTRRVPVPGITGEIREIEILGTLEGRLLWTVGFWDRPTLLLSAGETDDATLLVNGLSPARIVGRRLYFVRCTTVSDCAIWSSDGTAAGTSSVLSLGKVTDLEIMAAFADRWLVFQRKGLIQAYDIKLKRNQLLLSSSSNQIEVFPVEDTLFILTTSEEQDRLWASHLSSPRATLLYSGKNIGIAGSREDRLYFASDTQRLWSSDGTREGTRFYHGKGVENFSLYSNQLGPLGTTTLVAMPGYYWVALLAADETRQEVSTLLVACRGKYSCGGTYISPLTLAGGLAFAELDHRLVRSDGTREGTSYVPGLGKVDFKSFGVVGDRLVLGAESGGVQQLWETDGTAEGTKALSDGTRDRPFRVQGPPISFNGGLFVAAEKNPVGHQLWRVAEGRTVPLTDLKHLAKGVRPHAARRAGDRILLDGEKEWYWISIGEDGSTEELQDFVGSCSPDDDIGLVPCAAPAVSLGDHVFFRGRGSDVPVLWSTDGTSAGTFAVQGEEGYSLGVLALGRLRERALVLSTGGGLWTSDGSPDGTEKFAELPMHNVRESDVPVRAPVSLGPITFLFRRAPDPWTAKAEVLEVWRTDGTAEGTVRLASPPFPKDFSPFLSPVTIGGYLFFRFGGTLWRSDGTVAGTYPIPEQLPGGTRALMAGESTLYAVGGYLDDDVESVTLWAIDPKTLAARALGDFESIGNDGVGEKFGSLVGDTLFFGFNSDGKTEIWRTEGTAESTRQLPFTLASFWWNSFFTAGDQRYFSACEPEHGCELWTTDRLGENVRLVADFWPGPRSGDPEILAVDDKALLVAATEPTVGRELWKIDLTAVNPGASAPPQRLLPRPRESKPKRSLRSRGWI